MSNPLIRKLESFGDLPFRDRLLLDDVVKSKRKLRSADQIIKEGSELVSVHVVLDGIACRSKLLRSGGRQIFAHLLPGDFCDLRACLSKAIDFSVETLSPCEIVDIPRHLVAEMLARPALARAMRCLSFVDEATLRMWLVNFGQRDAVHRIAHLMCELRARLEAVDLADDRSFALPITQEQLGDTLGLTSVHVNRALQKLRRQGLIEFQSGMVTIPDLDQLQLMSDFDPSYLYVEDGGVAV